MRGMIVDTKHLNVKYFEYNLREKVCRSFNSFIDRKKIHSTGKLLTINSNFHF